MVWEERLIYTIIIIIIIFFFFFFAHRINPRAKEIQQM